MNNIIRRGLKAALFPCVCYYIYHVIDRFNNDSEDVYLKVIKDELQN